MTSRSLASALRGAGRLNKSSSKQLPAFLARGFSSTAANGVRHTFTKTDNPELDDVLQTIEEKIIFPSFLPKKQNKLIFDTTKRTFLAQNPVIIEVDGKEHKFAPLDRFKDLPNARNEYFKAVKLMKTRQEWANLSTLLSGYHSASVTIPAHHQRVTVRLASNTGNIFEIIECAKQVGVTKLKLCDHEIILRTFAAINEKITSNKWEADETMQAMRWSRVVMDLLHREEHWPEGANRAHIHHLTQGMYIFTYACAIRVMQAIGKPTNAEKVLLMDEVKLFITMWKPLMDTTLFDEADIQKLIPNKKLGLNGGLFAQILSQNVKGIALARELLEGQLGAQAQDLEVIQKKLEEVADSFLNQFDRRWQNKYDEAINLTEPLVEDKSAKEAVSEETPA